MTTIVPIILAVVGVLCLCYHELWSKDKIQYVDSDIYPVGASTYILKNINVEEIRLYNEYNYGSYLLFKDIPVFIDSRADLYAPEFSGLENDIFSDYLNVSRIEVFYETVFEKYNITHVIMYKESNVAITIEGTNDENYIKLYDDGTFVVFERVEENK